MKNTSLLNRYLIQAIVVKALDDMGYATELPRLEIAHHLIAGGLNEIVNCPPISPNSSYPEYTLSKEDHLKANQILDLLYD